MRYFFSDGLQFECTRCGTCCTGDPGIIRVGDVDITAIAAYLQVSLEDVRSRYVRMDASGTGIRERVDGACIFWGEDGCAVYPVRPLQCRLYPFWFQLLRNPDAWKAEQKRCPGIGRGRLWSEEEILERIWLSMESLGVEAEGVHVDGRNGTKRDDPKMHTSPENGAALNSSKALPKGEGADWERNRDTIPLS
ncbi:MAG: YkgJ family cysteine cluster protein [Thermodesulfobacteriota bacterium]